MKAGNLRNTGLGFEWYIIPPSVQMNLGKQFESLKKISVLGQELQ